MHFNHALRLLSPLAYIWEQLTAMFGLNKPSFQTLEVLSVHFVMSLLGKALGVDIRVALGLNAL